MISEVRKTAPNYISLSRERLISILNKFSIDLVIDVGANSGKFGLMLREIGFTGRIMSFEPHYGVFKRLEEAASQDGHWDVFNFAIGPSESIQELHIAEWSEFSSLRITNEHCLNHFGSQATHSRKVKVTVRTLEGVLTEQNIKANKIFIKLDTQGFDIEAFKSIGGFLDNVYALQTEVSLVPIYVSMPNIGDSLAFFEDKGFMVAGLYPVSQNEQSLVIYEFDCLMVRASKKLITQKGVDDVVPFCLDLLENNQ